jgi:17beta-estradiol 17-dehydrogenase / very-long-chain 3-oxoacyl-CoA reductase
MLEIVLPKMVQQKRGIIINISSQASERPVPLMTTYAASKY